MRTENKVCIGFSIIFIVFIGCFVGIGSYYEDMTSMWYSGKVESLEYQYGNVDTVFMIIITGNNETINAMYKNYNKYDTLPELNINDTISIYGRWDWYEDLFRIEELHISL